MFCAAITSVGWSQGLHVSSSGSFYVSPKAHVYVTNDLDVDASGDLTVVSDASNSGVLIVKGNATGDIAYVRSIADANWHFVSAPLETQGINDFTTGAGNTNDIATSGALYGVSIYNNSLPEGTRFEKYTTSNIAASGAFVNGKGYANKKNAAGTYTFKGTMATGTDVTITIPQYSDATYHWTLVGNPYPSFLPANNATTSLLKVNEGVLFPAYTYIKVWDAANNGYKILNYSSTGADANTYISPGQGFFVDPKDNTANSFVFPVNMQAVEPAVVPTFYKSVAATPSVVISASKGKETKSTTLKYFVNTTLGLDVGYDAGAFEEATGNDFAINTHLIEDGEGVDFTIQCLPNTNYETSIVPLSLKVDANESVTFSAVATNLPESLQVFLEDKVAGTITNITTTDHQITFTNSLEGVGRFYIHTASSVLSVEDAASFNTLSMYKTSNTNLRIAGLNDIGLGTISMYSISGKQVLATSFVMKPVNNITLPSNLSKGVYVVQFVSDNSKQTKKIIIE